MNLRPSGYEPDGHSWLPHPARFLFNLTLFFKVKKLFNSYYLFIFNFICFLTLFFILNLFLIFFIFLFFNNFLSKFLCFFSYFESFSSTLPSVSSSFLIVLILFLLFTVSIVFPHFGQRNWYSAATSNGTFSHISLHAKKT